MLGDNTGVYRIDGLFLNIKSLSFTGTLQGLLLCGHLHHTHLERTLCIHTIYRKLTAHAMTLCGVHDNMHVHTTVAHTCDYPQYLHRHTWRECGDFVLSVWYKWP